MQKLSLVDQVFYKLETSGMAPLYMCGASIVDPTDSPYPLDARSLADHLAACMEEVPLLRQKLVQDPLKVGDLQRVDDPDFDVSKHITITKLDAPGGYKELMDCFGIFSARRLDLSRPLWHIEIVEGLEGGRLAVAMHLHHAVIDGEGGKQAIAGMWNAEPIPARTPKKEGWQPSPEPTAFSLLRSAMVETGQRVFLKTPAFIFKNTSPILKLASAQIKKRFNLSKVEPENAMPKVYPTSLTVHKLSNKRVVSYIQLPLDEIKQLRTYYECSINDLALVLCSHTLQYYFDSIEEIVDFDLVTAMPINMRNVSDKGAGNKLGLSRVNLYNASVKGIDNQLQAIKKETAEIKAKTKRQGVDVDDEDKDSNGIDFARLSTLFSPIILDGLFYLLANIDLTNRLPFNIAVTNVPGVRGNLYMAGAKLEANIPMGPCGDGLGLVISITSSDHKLGIGFHGCGEAIKNKELFVKGVESGFAELKRLAKKKRNKKT